MADVGMSREQFVANLDAALSSINGVAPWLLSCLDRNPSSPSYGSFDRAFWYYKTEREFPAATYQMLSLALTCQFLDKSSQLHAQPAVLEWISASLENWARIQRGDGSFDEWLPYEQSHIATAFSLFTVTESLLVLRDNGHDVKISPLLMRALTRAGDWLNTNVDYVVLNHTAGAVAALHNLYLLTGNESYRAGSRHSLSVLASKQSKEGWFSEYGGADPGYTTVSIDYLGKYLARGGSSQAAGMAESAIGFLVDVQHPDGTLGGCYGSRNTRYMFPDGLLALCHIPGARTLLQGWAQSLRSGQNLGLLALDDRYRMFHADKWAQARLRLASLPAAPGFEVPARRPWQGLSVMADSGILRFGDGAVELIGSTKKLGTMELFIGSRRYSDAGYHLCWDNGVQATTQWQNDHASYRAGDTGWAFQSEGALGKLPDYRLTQKCLLPHRLSSHALGRVGIGSGRVSAWVKSAFIKPSKQVPAWLRREVKIDSGAVEIIDRLTWQGKVDKVFWTSGWGHAHVPSANFFTPAASDQMTFEVAGLNDIKIRTVYDAERMDKRLL